MHLTKEEAKLKIRDLVQNYYNNKDKLSKDSETDTRVKFIDRMFEALGWDVFGSTVSDEVLREVGIQEKEGRKKKADYTFKINGISRFVVEAKSMGESVFDPVFIVQAINYAYNKACSWAVLTNFHKLAIYYIDRNVNTPFYKIDFGDMSAFDQNFEILWYLSKENVINNLLETEAKRRGLKSDKVPIDKQLLNDLKIWRGLLSNDIRKRYKDYESYVIDEIVQRIIDRLIFIRKTEDGKLEEPKLDQIIRRHNDNTYGEIKKLFAEYRDKYDSKLFEEDRKTLHESDKIEISNDAIESVVRGMYRTRNIDIEYDFSAIDSDILGNIYEQYLAYVLSQTEKKVKLKGGISHRKEQGIYYTPTYIVDYIVKNTLGETLKKMKLKDVNKLRVLDPACGSGSFLIKAFDVLNDYYARSDENYQQTKLDLSNGTTFSKKVDIITNNIFGVDLDPKAVEISQLNLLLKIAERGQRLPVLQKNIKCGNSLIDDESLAGDRAFKWGIEFSDITKNGGFDVIIGNPPYGAELSEEEQNYLDKFYDIGSTDTSILFIKRSFELLRENGKLAFIVPKALCFASNYEDIRNFIWNNLETIVDCGKVWKEVKLEQVIFILSKGKKLEQYNSCRLRNSKIEYIGKINKSDSKQFEFFLNGVSSNDVELAKKIKSKSIMLNDISTNQRGAMLQKFVSKKGSLEVIGGAQIQRFGVVGVKGKIEPSRIDSEQAYVKSNSLLVQNIVAHIENPTDHIKIIAYIPQKNYVILDTINQLSINKEYSQKLIWCFLNSKLINWYAYRFIFGKAIRTMHFDNSVTSRLPIPKETNRKVLDEIISLSNKILLLSKRLNEINTKTDEIQKLEESICKIQKNIDYKIYELYGLTKEEIEIVENS
ncbi:MAG: N-6 DNA methylase [Candidatus Aenigmarchaeota archaeon]|nr:N-6 DNA methylase [Candidatus Aenigmarchaeota archaeon]